MKPNQQIDPTTALRTSTGAIETRVVTYFPPGCGVLLTRIDNDNLEIRLVRVDDAGGTHPIRSEAIQTEDAPEATPTRAHHSGAEQTGSRKATPQASGSFPPSLFASGRWDLAGRLREVWQEAWLGLRRTVAAWRRSGQCRNHRLSSWLAHHRECGPTRPGPWTDDPTLWSAFGRFLSTDRRGDRSGGTPARSPIGSPSQIRARALRSRAMETMTGEEISASAPLVGSGNPVNP